MNRKKEKAIINASLKSLVLNLKEDIENLNKQIDYNEDVQKAIDFSFRIVSLPEYENVALSNYNIEIKDIATEKTFLPSKTTFSLAHIYNGLIIKNCQNLFLNITLC